MSSKQPFFFLFLLLFYLSAAGQQNGKRFTREFALITENDNYDFELTDRYYSNGIFLNWNWWVPAGKNQQLVKKIRRLEIGHKIFNPVYNKDSAAAVFKRMDRPFAAWLYASYGQTLLYHNRSVLQYDLLAGIMGPSAMGRQVQQSWHQFWGLYKIYGWEYQVRDAPGLGAQAAYFHSIVRDKKGVVSFHAVSKATLSTIFTNASVGFLFQTGRLRPVGESGYWNANLGTPVQPAEKREWIFFIEPTVQWQAYNATVQGGLFRADKGPFTTDINPFVVQTKTGLLLTGRRIGLRWQYTFRSREGSNMKFRERWGTLGLTYRIQ